MKKRIKYFIDSFNIHPDDFCNDRTKERMKGKKKNLRFLK